METAVRDQIEISGVSRWDVVGVRAPNLRPGGTDEFTALATDGFEYDASCTSSAYGLMWPYTYDFPTGTPRCDNGATPDQAFPGGNPILVAVVVVVEVVMLARRCA